MDLNGKIVLVAGGAGGIGLGIARALAAEGCKVALADAVKTAGGNVGDRMMSNVSPDDFDRVMKINTTGTFNCIYAVLPLMRRKVSDLIVNIVSLAGKHVMLLAGMPYCVSKFATGALGTFVNMEECANGVKVTNIYPGETYTPIIDKHPSPPPPEKREKMLQPEDIAACVVTIAKLSHCAI